MFNVLNQSRGAALVMFLFTVLTNKVEGRLQLDLEVAQFCFDRNDGSSEQVYSPAWSSVASKDCPALSSV